MSAVLSPAFKEKLAAASNIVAFTGAGISAESGVPTFRGDDGIWKKFKPEELASMPAFMKNPDLVWEWYAHRRTVIGKTEPNAGHRALVRLAELVSRCTVVTQNIDNLHYRAGSRNVIELHGNIERSYCMTCGTPFNHSAAGDAAVPSCLKCGGRVRPDVVWFGEALPEDEWEDAVRAAQGADLFLSIGTSAVVYPAASLPLLGKRAGAYLVEINPDETPLTPMADEYLRGKSGDVLPGIVATLEKLKGTSSSEL
jgi:NAD-dependent deacetylase